MRQKSIAIQRTAIYRSELGLALRAGLLIDRGASDAACPAARSYCCGPHCGALTAIVELQVSRARVQGPSRLTLVSTGNVYLDVPFLYFS